MASDNIKKIKFSRVQLRTLELEHVYAYPIYYPKKEGIVDILIDANAKYTKKIERFIKENNIKDIYVLKKNKEQYEVDMQKYLAKIIDDENTPVIIKLDIMHGIASDVMNDLLEGDFSEQKIQKASDSVNNTVHLLLNDPKAIKAMLKVTTYDYYTYTHCVNVSTYALGFGTYLNFNEKQLKILGMAGMMHDMGKRKISANIIRKNGRLTNEEFETIKKHPLYGVELLKDAKETDSFLLDAVAQHHEKLDGSGYPYGLKKDEICIFAQILSIVDIFDALTTKRAYKDAMKSFEAFNIMRNEMKGELNENLLKKFIIFMSK